MAIIARSVPLSHSVPPGGAALLLAGGHLTDAAVLFETTQLNLQCRVEGLYTYERVRLDLALWLGLSITGPTSLFNGIISGSPSWNASRQYSTDDLIAYLEELLPTFLRPVMALVSLEELGSDPNLRSSLQSLLQLGFKEIDLAGRFGLELVSLDAFGFSCPAYDEIRDANQKAYVKAILAASASGKRPEPIPVEPATRAPGQAGPLPPTPPPSRHAPRRSRLPAVAAVFGGLAVILSLLAWRLCWPPFTGGRCVTPPDIPAVTVPGGEFLMGSDDGEPDERPARTVNVDEFRIMQTEVTNALYAACVAARACDAPANPRWKDPAFALHPVTGVDWEQANRFAAWAGGRLPTEAEWEKACRGVDGRQYPWGDEAPEAGLLNFQDAQGDTTESGAYSRGASPYRALDMSGNVWEWTADWYSDHAGATAPDRNPIGPQSGQFRVMRGGSYQNNMLVVRCAYRHRALPDSQDLATGFRVVWDEGAPSP